MTIDPQSITTAIFSQLQTAGAGVTVRAVLGAGADSVIAADRLALMPPQIPALPLVAWRGGAITGETKEMRIVLGAWWVYDALIQGYRRINGLIPLIATAYPFDAVPYGRILVARIGDETTDRALNLVCRQVQLAYYRRG